MKFFAGGEYRVTSLMLYLDDVDNFVSRSDVGEVE